MPFLHGDTCGRKRTVEHIAWNSMLQRCGNPNNKRYKRYGGRGIRVCKRWESSYANFLEDVGRKPDPSFTLERIDNNGNYEPGNVRWSSRSDQNRNTCRSIWVTYKGQKKTLDDLAAIAGRGMHAIRWRIFVKGMTPEEAVHSPWRKRAGK